MKPFLLFNIIEDFLDWLVRFRLLIFFFPVILLSSLGEFCHCLVHDLILDLLLVVVAKQVLINEALNFAFLHDSVRKFLSLRLNQAGYLVVIDLLSVLFEEVFRTDLEELCYLAFAPS